MSDRAFVPAGQEHVVRQCDNHPDRRAVMNIHNLRRDENFNACTACLTAWAFRLVSVYEGLGEAGGTVMVRPWHEYAE